MDENPYKSPAAKNDASPPTRRRTSPGRMVALVAVAVLIAFLMLEVWIYTARFPWSSGW